MSSSPSRSARVLDQSARRISGPWKRATCVMTEVSAANEKAYERAKYGVRRSGEALSQAVSFSVRSGARTAATSNLRTSRAPRQQGVRASQAARTHFSCAELKRPAVTGEAKLCASQMSANLACGAQAEGKVWSEEGSERRRDCIGAPEDWRDDPEHRRHAAEIASQRPRGREQRSARSDRTPIERKVEETEAIVA
jgi:hypothetical protein